MNILAKNDTKSSSDFIQRKKVVNAILNLRWSYRKTCSYYHISRSSAYRWVKKYKNNPCDRSFSLESHKPKTIPSNAYSILDTAKILNIHRRSPKKTVFEIWCDLQCSLDKFKPCYMTVLRVLRRNNIQLVYKTNKKKKHDGVYDTPTEVGIKWQIDVKFVPRECRTADLIDRFYQYTVLDECSRKRFLYFTNDHSMFETVRALKSAIAFFGYKPKILQSDNGFEFTDRARKSEHNDKINHLERYLKEVHIEHQLIRPRTPEHNGKVERSHRIDQEKFYRYLKFYSLKDLKEQGKRWMYKYNTTPKFVLGLKSPNEVELESLRWIYENYGEIRCSKCVRSLVN